ncbi:NAD(P)-binding Rossmann-like domain-containing protein [Chryseobacterium soldanellicola]|uniref:NAD(P)-binding Rossmann-like domain-containing protein n=1 Tax=Chryseobacterium soldanellicola TaxID=311333 RepID=A0A1H0ZZ39_9FLAO|nr:NAD(P)/FAD-dependent oxidoreductase [Chryseobacterium soldanellicola]SDQ32650.1 NAD(P)-binding Rossmann-like domain-containing protein [Chryseobacterium soldanellicola]
MKSGEKYSRKDFLKTIFLGSLMLPFLQYCERKGKSLLLKITGTNHVLGHKLWAKDFPKFTEEIRTKYLVVGGGISGLSACRFFSQNNENDYLLLEMEDHLGGNSSNGQNKFSKFPLGAHYLPLPNKENTEIIDFLKECNIYQGDDENGEPILDEYQMTFPQQERLFFKNSWQNDIVPQKGISEETQKEFDRFFKLMDGFRDKKGEDEKYFFAIPVEDSSEDSGLIQLEKMLFKSFLGTENFKSEELLWLLDYSCRDDYGLGIDYVSAWAGIHYFAGRKNNWSKKYKDQVFTWPEGNARLAKHFSKYTEEKSLTKHLVFDVKLNENKVEVLSFDNIQKKTKKIIAEKVLFATPQFVNERIFNDKRTKYFNYVPWLLTTITLKNEFGGDEELAWDNVIYGSDGLGYIYDQHQNVDQILGEKVITYYRSFSTDDCRKARKKLYSMKESELKSLVLDDLKKAHPLIEDFIIEMQFHKIGHAMIAPIPNQIFRNAYEAKQPIDGKIFFAHTDLSGISIFEEAFYQGWRTAEKMI